MASEMTRKKIFIVASVVIVLLGALLVVVTPRLSYAEGFPGGGGGTEGCDPDWNHSECIGAVWHYYKTSSNSVTIPTIDGAGVVVSNCGSSGGFFAYVLVHKDNPESNNVNDVYSWKIGQVGKVDKSEFFGGATRYYKYSDSNDPLPVNPDNGNYSWYSAKKAFALTKALGQNSGYEWDGNSSLGAFCYRGLDFTLTPSITGSPTFATGDSSGSDKATLTPIVTNAGQTTSSNAAWRVVNFKLAPGVAIPAGGDSNTIPETFFGNGAVTVANNSQEFAKGPTRLKVNPQAIGDFSIGTRVCYALSVTPITQTNSNWRHSTPFCIIIAKSPKVQVHGGDIRVGSGFASESQPANANINTSQTIKRR
ncbi:MAG: hypothetical protein WA030_00215 [Candidatus Microsaccharimonas sp.]